MKREEKKHLIKESRNTRNSIEMPYNARKSAIDFLDESTSRISEARH